MEPRTPRRAARPTRSAWALALVLALLTAGCGSGSTPPDPLPPPFVWFTATGEGCSQDLPSPGGCSYDATGTKITAEQDPYFATDYYLEYKYWPYYDELGNYSAYLGYAWLSPTGILYDDFGRALN